MSLHSGSANPDIHQAHDDSQATARLAKNWLIGAGLAALCLIAFLVWSDDYLSNSKKEEELTRILSEIRTAQTSLPSRVTDERQLK